MSDFQMFQGNNRVVNLRIVDPTGEAVNLLDCAIEWVLCKNRYSTPLVTKAATISDAASGECVIDLVPADTENLSGDFYHEAKLTDADGNVTTVVTGSVIIIPAVSS